MDAATPELTSSLLGALNKKNILNNAFVIGRNRRDGIGLGMHKSKMILFKWGEFPVNGIICSSNDLPNDNPSKM